MALIEIICTLNVLGLLLLLKTMQMQRHGAKQSLVQVKTKIT